MADAFHAIEVGLWDGLAEAREVRKRRDLSPAAMAALTFERARAAALVSLLRPGLPFTSDDVALALADAIGRWAAAAAAASPEAGACVSPWPDEPREGERMPH